MIALGKEKEKSLVKQTTATQEAWVTTIFFWKTNYSSTADSHTLPEHSQHGPVRSKENWFSGPTCPLGVPSYGGALPAAAAAGHIPIPETLIPESADCREGMPAMADQDRARAWLLTRGGRKARTPALPQAAQAQTYQTRIPSWGQDLHL